MCLLLDPLLATSSVSMLLKNLLEIKGQQEFRRVKTFACPTIYKSSKVSRGNTTIKEVST